MRAMWQALWDFASCSSQRSTKKLLADFEIDGSTELRSAPISSKVQKTPQLLSITADASE